MAGNQTLFERFAGALALLSIALVVSGSEACQEDYDLGSQVSITPTGTPEPTETPSDDLDDDDDDLDDDDLVTRTPTPEGTPDEATPTPDPDDLQPTATPNAAIGGGLGTIDEEFDDEPVELMQELALLGERPGAKKEGNWLGDNFGAGVSDSSKDTEPSTFVDSDGDGFSDTLENALGSLPMDALSVPDGAITTNLDARVRAVDSDFDGISDEDEAKGNTNSKSLDTDLDGYPDGAEILSNSNPTVPDQYPDRDHDGLSDEFERTRGINIDMPDSDNDGLRDDLELVVGSDPLNPDSDGDGISDGKEFELSSDPTIAENTQR